MRPNRLNLYFRSFSMVTAIWSIHSVDCSTSTVLPVSNDIVHNFQQLAVDLMHSEHLTLQPFTMDKRTSFSALIVGYPSLFRLKFLPIETVVESLYVCMLVRVHRSHVQGRNKWSQIYAVCTGRWMSVSYVNKRPVSLTPWQRLVISFFSLLLYRKFCWWLDYWLSVVIH